MIDGSKRLQELAVELNQARYNVILIEGKIMLLQEFLAATKAAEAEVEVKTTDSSESKLESEII